MTTHTSRDHEVVVVGGGQAGLAIGHHLAKRKRRFTILEAAQAPANAWRERWDSLRLFTPARYDSLPGRPFPGDPRSYPGRDEVVDYLTSYARDMQLPIELGCRVRSLRRDDADGYALEVGERTITADQVVVATGPFQAPRVPPAAADLHGDVMQLHSSEYWTPDAIPPGPVLVVGGGNTGFQLAAELSATHEVHLSIGSRQIPLPTKVLGRELFSFLEATGLMAKNVDSRLAKRAKENETLIGSSKRSLRRGHGVQFHPRTVGAAGTHVSFEGGTSVAPSSVIWATGFSTDHSWIDVPVFDADGGIAHRRGVTGSRGLYFVGLPWMYTRGSALLGWVGQDAEYLADHMDTTRPAKPHTPAAPARVARESHVPSRRTA